jgi:hypothetical protein
MGGERTRQRVLARIPRGQRLTGSCRSDLADHIALADLVGSVALE